MLTPGSRLATRMRGPWQLETTSSEKKDPVFSLRRLWGTGVDSDFPNSLAELTKYGVIILSDIGSDSLRLYPEVMKGRRGVDRSKLIHEFVEKGGGLLMCGGYLSFGGYHNTARYHDTPIEEALPVLIKDGDDRVDIPDGFKFSLAREDQLESTGMTRTFTCWVTTG